MVHMYTVLSQQWLWVLVIIWNRRLAITKKCMQCETKIYLFPASMQSRDEVSCIHQPKNGYESLLHFINIWNLKDFILACILCGCMFIYVKKLKIETYLGFVWRCRLAGYIIVFVADSFEFADTFLSVCTGGKEKTI